MFVLDEVRNGEVGLYSSRTYSEYDRYSLCEMCYEHFLEPRLFMSSHLGTSVLSFCNKRMNDMGSGNSHSCKI